MTDTGYDDLARDLALLGRGIDAPTPSEELSLAVMSRIPFMPRPAPLTRPTSDAGRWWETVKSRMAAALDTRRRRVAIVVATVLLAVFSTPPVRAAVADWFGFGGVIVEKGDPDPGTVESPPEVTQGESLTDAAEAVDFTVLVPTELGEPSGVEVTDDARLVSMSWSSDEDGIVRLDEFDATLDYSVLKQTRDFQFTSVDGNDAIWFEKPHDVALLDANGAPRTESARLAGHTLVWVEGSTTLRLEGDLTRQRAVEIAESSEPVE